MKHKNLIQYAQPSSRENKKPLKADAQIRNFMRSGTLCSTCAYASDSCKTVEKRVIKIHDELITKECKGYAQVLH